MSDSRASPSNGSGSTVEFVELEDDTNTLVFDLGKSYRLRMTPIADGFRIRLCHGETQVYYIECDRDWWESRNKLGQIGNEIAEDIGDSPSWVKSQLRKIANKLDAANEELVEELRNPEVDDILQRTNCVIGYDSGDELEMWIEIDAPDDSDNDAAEWSFTLDEWMGDATYLINKKHFHSFDSHVELSEDDWEDLRDAWEDMEERQSVGTDPERERIAELIIDTARSRLVGSVFEDRDKAANDKWNGWYEPAGGEYSDPDDPVVWVRSEALQNAIDDETGKSGHGYIGKLTSTMDRLGMLAGESKRPTYGSRKATSYPIRLDALDLDEDDVILADDDDDPDGEVPEP